MNDEPRSWQFTLPFEKPPKGLSSNHRVHWSVKHRATQTIRFAVSGFVRALSIPTLNKCRIDVVWVVNTRHTRDTDNLGPLIKAIYDGIGSNKGTSAHIVPDDDPTHMEKPGATIRYEPESEPHFEVLITDLGESL